MTEGTSGGRPARAGFDRTGKRVIVVGGKTGAGLGVAQAAHAAGAAVVVASRRSFSARLPERPAAAIVTGEDFVTGLARDIELAAQHRHLLALQQPGHETSVVRPLWNTPATAFASPGKCRKVLPMCSE